MVDIFNIIIKIFALVGLISLTVITLYYIAKALKKYKPKEEPLWPDEEYMEKIGVICPTGWVYKGKQNGKSICQNVYSIPIADEKECYDDTSNKTTNFDTISDWQQCQDDTGNCRALRNRCTWIKKCGPKSNIIDPTKCTAAGKWETVHAANPYASWIGVANKC
jgi:hypothetical protein